MNYTPLRLNNIPNFLLSVNLTTKPRFCELNHTFLAVHKN